MYTFMWKHVIADDNIIASYVLYFVLYNYIEI